MRRYSRTFLWTSSRYYLPTRKLWEGLLLYILQKYGGPLDQFDKVEDAPITVVHPAPTTATVKA